MAIGIPALCRMPPASALHRRHFVEALPGRGIPPSCAAQSRVECARNLAARIGLTAAVANEFTEQDGNRRDVRSTRCMNTPVYACGSL